MVSLIMKLSVVTLNYKKKEMTAEYMASLYTMYKQEFEKGIMELIFVDNASQDGSVEFLKNEIKKKNYKNIHLIENAENAGFAKGCNLGASNAKGEFILFLNNDVKIQSRGFLEMTDYMKKNSQAAIMGGRMKNADGLAQLSTWKFYTLGNAILMLLGFERFGMLNASPDTISKVDWVTGGCMMIKKTIFNELGGFDKHFFMYMEDMELCYRAKKSRYSVYYYPDLTIIHVGQGSSNRTFAIVNIYKGLVYFYKKHMPYWQYLIITLLLKTKAIILVLIGRISGNSYFLSTYGKAISIS